MGLWTIWGWIWTAQEFYFTMVNSDFFHFHFSPKSNFCPLKKCEEIFISKCAEWIFDLKWYLGPLKPPLSNGAIKCLPHRLLPWFSDSSGEKILGKSENIFLRNIFLLDLTVVSIEVDLPSSSIWTSPRILPKICLQSVKDVMTRPY